MSGLRKQNAMNVRVTAAKIARDRPHPDLHI